MNVLGVEPITNIEGPLPGGFYRVNEKTYLTGVYVTHSVLSNPENFVLRLVMTDLFGEYFDVAPREVTDSP